MIANDQAPPTLAPEDERRIERPKTVRRPLALVICSVMLALVLASTSILLFVNQRASLTSNFSLHHRGLIPQSISSVVPTFTSTALPSVVVPPTPQPVPFLPDAMGAQVTDLQAHNRFFFHGNPALPEIALTFDDGPHPTNTPQILAILKKYQVHATFFDVGRLVQLYPDLARQELADGHVVGNHTWSHPFLPFLAPAVIKRQLRDTSAMIERVIGVRPLFFRPPYGAPPFGSNNGDVFKVVNQFGLTTVIWNVDPQDWSVPGTAAIVWRVLASAGNGSIVLMHDGGGNRLQTIAALPTIIEQLRARHFQFVTVAQLVADYHSGQVPSVTPKPPYRHPHAFQDAPFGWQKRELMLLA